MNSNHTHTNSNPFGTFVMPPLWTKEAVHREALKYETRTEFYKGCVHAYCAAAEKGWLFEICSHMKTIRERWSYEKMKSVASQYDDYAVFRKEQPNAYNAIRGKKLIPELCKHMKRTRPPGVNKIPLLWTKENIHREALKYKTRNDFRIQCPNAYNAARRKGILEEVCDHMLVLRKRRSKISVLRASQKYNSRSKFANCDPRNYNYALNHGWLDECFPAS